MGEWVAVGAADEGAPNELRAVDVGMDRIVVVRTEQGEWLAFDDMCTHEECPLSDGEFDGERIVCYCHSGTFDARTGAPLEGPVDEPLPVYETRVVEGRLEICV